MTLCSYVHCGQNIDRSGRTIAQSVNGFSPRSVRVGFVDHVVLGQGFLPVFCFAPSMPILRCSILIYSLRPSLCDLSRLPVFDVCVTVRHWYNDFFNFTLDAGLLARSQYSEGPATGHLDTGFSRFPCVYKQTLRRFPTFQFATTCFSCNPPDLNLVVTNFVLLQMPDCWLEVSIRKVLRPATSTQVFLGFPVPISKRSDGSQRSKLPLHASHVALQT